MNGEIHPIVATILLLLVIIVLLGFAYVSPSSIVEQHPRYEERWECVEWNETNEVIGCNIGSIKEYCVECCKCLGITDFIFNEMCTKWIYIKVLKDV